MATDQTAVGIVIMPLYHGLVAHVWHAYHSRCYRFMSSSSPSASLSPLLTASAAPTPDTRFRQLRSTRASLTRPSHGGQQWLSVRLPSEGRAQSAASFTV
ncbi:hypothetical protein LY76DRAFT_599428 [Colletotrichum caudatum]|nr:hypothetical protein LY76DRAFT_599428 [Colletotrichum caudatum]